MGTIKGTLLAFDPEDNLQGIFFMNEDGTEIKVDVVGQNQARGEDKLHPDVFMLRECQRINTF